MIRPRLDSVDIVRGLVMVLMALDHVRDMTTNVYTVDPLNLSKTHAALFLTRWITHYCAPVFVFLAGAGAFLAGTRGKTSGELARFLVTRGLWLVLLELTVIRLGWQFNLDYRWTFGQVIWAIGWSMVALAALVRLPARVVGCIGVAIVALHNLTDGWTGLGPAWKILHARELMSPAPGYYFWPAYPLIPWIGVICAGYGFGTLLVLDTDRRRRILIRLGLVLIALFIALRFTNWYGDTGQWSVQKNLLFTVFSFVNTQKYGPSLLFTLMTLGPAILLMGLWSRGVPKPAAPFVVFGRVPLFYYLLHLPLIHSIAVLISYIRHGRAEWLFSNPPVPGIPSVPPPPDYGVTLPMVYLLWAIVVVILYFPCRWFAALKQRNRSVWLSYL